MERASEPRLTHQTRHTPLPDAVAPLAEVVEDAWGTVRLPTRRVRLGNDRRERSVGLRALALGPYERGLVPAPTHAEHAAGRSRGELALVLSDEGVDHSRGGV